MVTNFKVLAMKQEINAFYDFRLEKLSGFHEKWANSNIKWSYSRDWPTRSHCEKLITPERGSGFYAEQPLVPIRTMRKVEAPPKLAIASEVCVSFLLNKECRII